MKLFKSSLIAFGCMMALTACDTDDPKNTIQYGYSNNVTYVTSLEDNSTSVLEGAHYILDFDITNSKADVDITNLRLTPGGSLIRLRIEDASFGLDSQTGAIVINVPNTTSIIGGNTHTISNFKMSQTSTYIAALGQTAVYYSTSYVVDNKYSVVAVQGSAYLPGTTVITSTTDASNVKNSDRTFYSYVFNREKGTATLGVYALDLNGKYYSQVTFENLPYSITAAGILINCPEGATGKIAGTSSTESLVAKSISMNSRFDGTSQINIVTEDYNISASLKVRYQAAQ